MPNPTVKMKPCAVPGRRGDGTGGHQFSRKVTEDDHISRLRVDLEDIINVTIVL